MLHAETLSRNPITGRQVWFVRQIPSGVYGDPFTWTCALVKPWHCSSTVTIKGLAGAGFTAESWQEINDLLHSMGFTQAKAQRRGRWRVYPVR